MEKLLIKNFRKFREFEMSFESGLNVIVGANDQGKSTIMEAVNLALTGRWQGRLFSGELNPHFINAEATQEYLAFLKKSPGEFISPPEVLIELYLSESNETNYLSGNNNSEERWCPGFRVRAALDDDLRNEYIEHIKHPSGLTRVPTEFYKVDWNSFNSKPVNPRAVPIRSAIIDSSRIRLQSGTDYYLKQIVEETLTLSQRSQLSAAYRRAQEQFSTEASIETINETLDMRKGSITRKSFTLDVDVSKNNTWGSALTPHLDKVPFTMLGSGEQSKLKIMLALARRADDVRVVLIEEPENHLAFGELNKLVHHIRQNSEEHQLIIATHSSYVLNKLGLSNLLLLGNTTAYSLESLSKETSKYFSKLSGYDTLRLVLAKRVALVEGPSDELVIQKAYKDAHGRMPIDDGVDVINVRGLSAPRFLELAEPLERECVVITDNDGDYESAKERYEEFLDQSFVTICIGENNALKTLEPQLVDANGYEKLNRMLGKDFGTDEEVQDWMENSKNKTEAALRLLESSEKLLLPPYLQKAVDALGKGNNR
ncbi:ATP-dependent nuclease [Enteractinococcus helveticum]|uniref:ATP-dependent nuclease n=1 Tax=Enteractinococcus helveticum TaxID=1837282 RepID=UPI00137278D7|nr:AAA family ATPase [Enteractinococcus helveticum]